MQKWIKKGLIYCPSGKNGFDKSHCHKPTPLIIDDDTVRVYFGVRDENSKTRTTFIDLSINNLNEIKYVHNKPVIDLGKIGCFDDSGANVCSVVKKDSKIFMYYIGWNPSTTVHTRNSIGVIFSEDNGFSFNRIYDGSILDRDKLEPYYTGAVDVKYDEDENIWKMWYTSGSEWKMVNNKPEIFYHIKYATSKNGIDWDKAYTTCIKPQNEFECTARPSVIKANGKYLMWYSRRNIIDFRTDFRNGYRGGFAESDDGINWIRKDNEFGLDISSNAFDWDSQAIAYPYVIKIKDKLVMFYNGNGFGKTGFGYAVLEE
ncbi:MAG: hypothetical protein IKC23_00195 [Fibrobacter sp.]|nr:hypothetical protein [Fibrobacter sp.]MBR2898036.1 hypothetical protein [Fibrobacter sp.]